MAAHGKKIGKNVYNFALLGPNDILGRSRAILNVLKAIGAVADRPTNILIRGEPGSGKGLVARVIVEKSYLKDRPFVIVNCAASEAELERKLPGYFKKANGGTILLKKIDKLPPRIQHELENMLEDGFVRLPDQDVHVRIIATAARELDLKEFSAPLYYRLADAALIEVPPLRQHTEDLAEIARVFLEKGRAALRAKASAFSPKALHELQAQAWPGNVAQLEDVICRALRLSRRVVLDQRTMRKALAQCRMRAA